MYPIDKVNLDVLRIAHFLALAAITVRFVRSDWPALQSVWFRPGDPVRPAFAGDLLPRHLPVVCRALRVHRAFRPRRLPQVLVSALGIAIMFATAALISWYKQHRRAKSRIAFEAAGCGPRGRRGMREWTAAGAGSLLACVGVRRVRARTVPIARWPRTWFSADYPAAAGGCCRRQARASSTVAVVGAGSSTLSARADSDLAYPARLQAILPSGCPSVKTKVVMNVKPRRSAEEMAEAFEKTTDGRKAQSWLYGSPALSTLSPESTLRSTARPWMKGSETLQAGGADVVLMNMQYSPRNRVDDCNSRLCR